MSNQSQHLNSLAHTASSVFICECSSTEHQIIVQYDAEDNLVYCHIHLTNQSFWNRLKLGIKYIFGYHCRYGHWDEFIWRPEHATKLRELADLLSKQEGDFTPQTTGSDFWNDSKEDIYQDFLNRKQK